MKKKFILVAAALVAAVIFYGCEKFNDYGPGNSDTSADYTYVITDNANRTVTFTNKSSHAEDYSWKFGDNTGSTAESPQHSYSSSGNYTVSLTASGHCGGSNTVSKTVTFSPN